MKDNQQGQDKQAQDKITDFSDWDDFRRGSDRMARDMARENVASVVEKESRAIEKDKLARITWTILGQFHLLDRAVRNELRVEGRDSGEKWRQPEYLSRRIFFPFAGMETGELAYNQHFWLLIGDCLDYNPVNHHGFNHVGSGTSLGQLKSGDEIMFEDDIDKEISAFLERTGRKNEGYRPELIFLDKDGPVVIIDFRPCGASLDQHEKDLVEYAGILAAKSRGRFNRFHGYLIGDTINLARLANYKPLYGRQGWFNTMDLYAMDSRERKMQTVVGELHLELLMYDDVIRRAIQKIWLLRKQLGISGYSVGSNEACNSRQN